MNGRLTSPPRVAAVLPLSVDWQPVVPFDLAGDRCRVLAQATAMLAGATLVEASVVASPNDGAEAGQRALAADAEVLLVLATMAALPSLVLAAIEQLPDVPVVVWAIQRSEVLDDRAGHASIVLDGGTVGAPMVTSLLLRAGRPFELVLGPAGDPGTVERVEAAVRAGAAARRISRARVGRIGRAAEGYGCTELDEGLLRDGIGVTVVDLAPADLVQVYGDVPDARVRAVVAETRESYGVDVSLGDDDLARAARAAAALEAITVAHDLDAGVLTCHVPGIRRPPGLGFAPCFALGRMTSAGVPWNCSSDLPAAMAMLTLKALGGAAQYHELEMLDRRTGEFFVASSGEHDLAFARERPLLVRNGWFPTDRHASVCACVGGKPGPATLVGFAQRDAPTSEHRLVVASGSFGDRRFPASGTPNASFRFADGSPVTAWEAWCRAGVGLHTACSPGSLAASVEATGRFLGIEVVHVCGTP